MIPMTQDEQNKIAGAINAVITVTAIIAVNVIFFYIVIELVRIYVFGGEQ